MEEVNAAVVIAEHASTSALGRTPEYQARMEFIEEIARRGSWAIDHPASLGDLEGSPDADSQFARRWPTFWERTDPTSFAEAVGAWAASRKLPRHGRWKQVATAVAKAGLGRCRPASLHRQWIRWSRPEVWRRPFPEV